MRASGGSINPKCEGCRRLRELLEAAGERVAELEKRLEQLERQAHRQAAPFRRPEQQRKAKKGKPGRKPGHKASYRRPPPVVDEWAQVPLERCPHCAGPVRGVRPVQQIIEDIPPVRIRRLHITTYRGQCDRCGKVCSIHPEQVSTAVGAAGTHLGRNALALATDLNKHWGIPMRKTCRILREHFGLPITPGGLSQALMRIAGKLQGPFEQLQQAVRRSEAIHADETGWWLGGKGAFLWVFTEPGLTLYTIDNRSQEVVRRILGDDYAGVLISDCLSSYDPHPGRKSKCCAHHLKAIREALEQAPGSRFLCQIRAFFKAAIALHRAREHVPPAPYGRAVAHLQRSLDARLGRTYSHPAEERIANRLRKQRPHLLTFLEVPGVDPTNNLAERQLRPAVISRKLSCGNKTLAGKHCWEVLASLAATCAQQGASFPQLVAAALTLAGPAPSLFATD